MYTNWQKNSCRLGLLARRWSSVAETAKAPETAPTPPPSTRPLPPPRIKRGPTDILRALSATVGHDPTAPHYKYHDDPFLIPQSNFRKRSHALAQEAGRKAAVWLRDQHAELFTTREWDPPLRLKTEHYNAEPRVPAFAPKPVYDDNSQVTVDDLRYTIDNALVEDAITVFRLLGGVSAVERETAQALLELLSFYDERPSSSEWPEERWFAGRERRAPVWKNGGLAEEIFNSLEPKDAAAYNAIIQGMAKYRQMERAHQLSRVALENGVQLSTETYNQLLGHAGYMREGTELRLQLVQDMLHEMKQQGVSPNSGTLDACVSALAGGGGGRQLRTFALKLVAEFRSIGVQPSLTAYYHILTLMCKERGPKVDVLSSILDDLERRDRLDATDASDVNFFVTAMSVCNEHLQDMGLADRVHALLMSGDNYRLLGDAFRESIYCRHLITVACRTAPLERTLQFLDQMVPNVYVPEPSVMDEIIKALSVGGEGRRLAQCWRQLVVFGHARRVNLLETLLEALRNCYQLEDEDVRGEMRRVAKEMLYFGDTSQEENKEFRAPQATLSAGALSHVVSLCSEAGASEAEWEAAAEAVRRLRAGGAGQLGVPDPAPLAAFTERAVRSGRLAVAPLGVLCLVEAGLPGASAACEAALAVALNRAPEETRALLSAPSAALAGALQPELVPLLDAYRMSELGSVESRGSSSSESDSEGASSDSD